MKKHIILTLLTLTHILHAEKLQDGIFLEELGLIMVISK